MTKMATAPERARRGERERRLVVISGVSKCLMMICKHKQIHKQINQINK